MKSNPKSLELEKDVLKLGKGGKELLGVLYSKNGFLAFESALQVYPLDPTSELDVIRWNASDVWEKGYGDRAKDLFFFAQDVFGMQFALRDRAVWFFDTETGMAEPVADNIENWAALVLDDFEGQTGYSLAHDWQKKNGPLALGHRLAPRIPFVLGGEYDIGNLYPADMFSLLGFRANLAAKLSDLPDGAKVNLSIIGEISNP